MITLSYDNGGSVLFLSISGGFSYRSVPPTGHKASVRYFKQLARAIQYAKTGKA